MEKEKIFFNNREISEEELNRIKEELKDKQGCRLVESMPNHWFLRLKD